MKLTVHIVPNPDFNETFTPYLVERLCNDLEDAAGWAKQIRYEHDLGGGNWSAAVVFDDTGLPLARISYNGRFWDPETNAEIIL